MSLHSRATYQTIENIGKSLRARRIQLGISQEDLSDQSGVSLASITRLETGKGNPSLTNFLALLSALDLGDEFQAIFDAPTESPLLLAKATSRKTKKRVRHSKNVSPQEAKQWVWKEDQE